MSERYDYECSKGHEIGNSPPITVCPLWTLGEPCDGELKAVGEGSAKANKLLREARQRDEQEQEGELDFVPGSAPD